MRLPALGKLDLIAYGSFTWFCGVHGTEPWSIEKWFAMTERSVMAHEARWKMYTTYDPNAELPQNEDGTDNGEAPRHRAGGMPEHDLRLVGDIKEVCGAVRIGELRKDGSVRPQTKAARGRVVKVALTFRTCRHCKQLLPAACFSIKRKTMIREVCRKCDNKRRRKGIEQ